MTIDEAIRNRHTVRNLMDGHLRRRQRKRFRQ